MFLFLFEQEYTCPLCAGGFIEELPPNGSNDRSRSTSSNDDVELGEYDNHRLNERISSLLMSSIGGGLRSMDDDSDQSSNQDGSSASTFLFATHTHSHWHSSVYIWLTVNCNRFLLLGGQRPRRNNRGRRAQDMPNFENIMQEFLISISVNKLSATLFWCS